MIKIIIFENKNKISGFEMSGHAEYDEYGKDIVCAAATMLAFNTIDTFTDILKLEDNIDYIVKDNIVEIKLQNNLNDDQMRDSQLILRKFELGIKSLLQEYSDYVELYYMEV